MSFHLIYFKFISFSANAYVDSGPSKYILSNYLSFKKVLFIVIFDIGLRENGVRRRVLRLFPMHFTAIHIYIYIVMALEGVTKRTEHHVYSIGIY